MSCPRGVLARGQILPQPRASGLWDRIGGSVAAMRALDAAAAPRVRVHVYVGLPIWFVWSVRLAAPGVPAYIDRRVFGKSLVRVAVCVCVCISQI